MFTYSSYIVLIVYIAISLLLALFVGRKRHTGFGWSFLLSVIFTPIIGVLITLLTPKKDTCIYESGRKKGFGVFLIVLFVINLINFTDFYKDKEFTLDKLHGTFAASFGMLFLGVFLIYLGAGKTAEKNPSDEEKKVKDVTQSQKALKTKEYIHKTNTNISIKRDIIKGNSFQDISKIEMHKQKEGNSISQIKIDEKPIYISKTIERSSPKYEPEFINPAPEEQSKIKYIGYTPSFIFEQRVPIQYPIVVMPKEGCVIKFPRKGKTGLRGFVEDSFKPHLNEIFGGTFQVLCDRFVLIKSNRLPYEPDIMLIDEKDGINLFIDIEIDEPYDGVTRQPIHYIGYDDQRNSFLKNRGWLTIRFAEYQIVNQPYACCKFLAKVINSIIPSYNISVHLGTVNEVKPIKQWTREESVQMAQENYREKYLGIRGFGVRSNTQQFVELKETSLGSQIEGEVDEGDIDNSYLIVTAIQLNIYISCRIKANKYYTVLKPLSLDEEQLSAYCYVKNTEVIYSIDSIADIILKEKPFIYEINSKDTPKIKQLIQKYLDYTNPILLEYVKGNQLWGWVEDIDTGEKKYYEPEITTRTISSFNIPSKVRQRSEILEYRLNDEDYIVGFCHLRNEDRTLKISRIHSLKILNI